MQLAGIYVFRGDFLIVLWLLNFTWTAANLTFVDAMSERSRTKSVTNIYLCLAMIVFFLTVCYVSPLNNGSSTFEVPITRFLLAFLGQTPVIVNPIYSVSERLVNVTIFLLRFLYNQHRFPRGTVTLSTRLQRLTVGETTVTPPQVIPLVRIEAHDIQGGHTIISHTPTLGSSVPDNTTTTAGSTTIHIKHAPNPATVTNMEPFPLQFAILGPQASTHPSDQPQPRRWLGTAPQPAVLVNENRIVGESLGGARFAQVLVFRKKRKAFLCVDDCVGGLVNENRIVVESENLKPVIFLSCLLTGKKL